MGKCRVSWSHFSFDTFEWTHNLQPGTKCTTWQFYMARKAVKTYRVKLRQYLLETAADTIHFSNNLHPFQMHSCQNKFFKSSYPGISVHSMTRASLPKHALCSRHYTSWIWQKWKITQNIWIVSSVMLDCGRKFHCLYTNKETMSNSTEVKLQHTYHPQPNSQYSSQI